MPEGHTIHRLAARHRELFAGQRIEVTSPQGRFAAGAALVSGRALTGTEAYGKHLLHHYDNGLAVHVHLGLYGRFADGAVPPPDPIGQVRMRMVAVGPTPGGGEVAGGPTPGGGEVAGEDGLGPVDGRAAEKDGPRRWLDLRGPTACEVLEPDGVAALIARLGADPLRDDADPDAAYRRLSVSTRPVFALLMDQSIVAGCGLIYANEVLFRAGLDPTTPGRRIGEACWDELWTDLRALMKEGVARGRIDTVHTAHTPEAMRRAPRMDRHGGEVYVYRRPGQPCHVCGTAIARGPLAGRNLYWCPTCQPAAAASGSRG